MSKALKSIHNFKCRSNAIEVFCFPAPADAMEAETRDQGSDVPITFHRFKKSQPLKD